MDKIEICKKLKETTRQIIIHDDEEIISKGSGVIINSKGGILTAAHVVTTRLPVRKEDDNGKPRRRFNDAGESMRKQLAGDDGQQTQEHAGFQESAQEVVGQLGPQAIQPQEDVEHQQVDQKHQDQVGCPVRTGDPRNKGEDD